MFYVLEGYEFIEEELWRDVIYNKKNDVLWMWIEVFLLNKSVKEINKEIKEILRVGFLEVVFFDIYFIYYNLEIVVVYKVLDDKSNVYGFFVWK